MNTRHRGRLEVVHVDEADTATMNGIHEVVTALHEERGETPPADSLHSTIWAAAQWVDALAADFMGADAEEFAGEGPH